MHTRQGPSSRTKSRIAAPWWKRDDLGRRQGRLHLAGADLHGLARSMGTPLYAYSAPRLSQNLSRIQDALDARSLDHRILYAMKSNRFAPLLGHLRAQGTCGIDACSPGEVHLARGVGFEEADISFTGNSVADRDLDQLLEFERLWINLDSVSAIQHLGRRAPGREVGIRIDPGVGIGYGSHELLRYSGERPTKFGVDRSSFDEALEAAREHDLEITGLHVHAGCGYLTPQLPAFAQVLEACLWFLDRVPGVRHLNVGGGLGIPLVEADGPLDLSAWCDVLADRLGDRGIQIWVEPGDYIAKDSGALILQVATVDVKQGVRFVGVDGGVNIHIEPAFYGLPLEVVPVLKEPSGVDPETLFPTTVVGNINEALDVWGRDLPLPALQEGDYLAFLNAGGYGSSMSSNHCLRGNFSECLVH